MKPEHIRIADAIWDDDRLTTNEKIVALCILKHRNNKTGKAFPKQPTICRKIKLSLPTVKRAVKTLVTLNIIDAFKLGGRNNNYEFNV